MIGRCNIIRPRRNDLVERRKRKYGISADAALAASSITEATANNRQLNLFPFASLGRNFPKSMEEEAASYYGVGRKGGYRTKKGGNNE